MTSLSSILRLNAASCLGFGMVFTIMPSITATMLGTISPGVVFGLGVLLLSNGGHLAFASFRPRAVDAEILWFTLGDMAWWLASMALIAAGVWITTPLGVTLALSVATFVATLGVAQMFALGRQRSELSAFGQWRRIGQSWLSLAGWVKVWLILLNAVFIVAPVFVPWDAARAVLIAYAASGPLLLAFVVHAGGLTRALGIGHIVPWVPLLAWLATRTDAFNIVPVCPSYLLILGMVVVVCLAFDFHDAFRWWKGEREIFMRTHKSK